MKFVIAGGSGQLGSLLTRNLRRSGHDVSILTTRPVSGGSKTGGPQWIHWDGESSGNWAASLESADVLINLAGRSVDCRYNRRNRQEIMDSRVLSTRVLGRAVAACKEPPRVWLQSSTATIYAHRYDAPNDEVTGILGGGEPNAPSTWTFSIEVARAWEAAATEVGLPNTRQVLMRSAMVMGPDAGGVFDTLLRLVRWGLGGRVGDGRQFMSWIHGDDFVRAILWLVEHEELSGAVNISSPNPLPQSEFMRALRWASGTRLGLPATRWMLEIGTFLLRTESELILKSRRVIPRRLIDSGFTFQFPDWPSAAEDLYQRRKKT